jgi:hypothetical protein
MQEHEVFFRLDQMRGWVVVTDRFGYAEEIACQPTLEDAARIATQTIGKPIVFRAVIGK